MQRKLEIVHHIMALLEIAGERELLIILAFVRSLVSSAEESQA